ncbi:matrix metalloproteinase [Abeliophyllum distichum]|uniref:Matrix metalloproteinase n=1 Tax=Abeliophyllum distichum TaxID=126358 RepID=A0ABD1R0X8_9LAMI
MKLPLFIPIIFLLLFSISPTCAHFFPNITSIPHSLIPNTTIWEAFNQLLGCYNGQKVDGLTKLKKYLQYFSYLNFFYSNFSDDFDDYLESAIKTYQLNFNLNAIGELDEQTLKHIVQPRCGNADIVNGTSTMNSGKQPGTHSSNSTIHTVAHYEFFPGKPRWQESKTELTYAFLPENHLSKNVKSLFGRAFERWSEVMPLTFTETTSYSRGIFLVVEVEEQ